MTTIVSLLATFGSKMLSELRCQPLSLHPQAVFETFDVAQRAQVAFCIAGVAVVPFLEPVPRVTGKIEGLTVSWHLDEKG